MIDKRRFYRHPISVPIALSSSDKKNEGRSHSLDVSLGGLSFVWPHRLSRGALVDVNITVKEKLFEIKSKVAYAKQDGETGQFRTGVCFTDYPSAFMARLAEEMLEIMEYRKNLPFSEIKKISRINNEVLIFKQAERQFFIALA